MASRSRSRTSFIFPRLSKAALLLGFALTQVTLFSEKGSATPPLEQVGARITFADGQSIALRARDRFRPIAVSAGETVTIDAQLPAQFANAPAFAQPLDGGVASEVVIAADGTTSFNFQVGLEPGLYRLLLGAFGKTAVLQFQVPTQSEG